MKFNLLIEQTLFVADLLLIAEAAETLGKTIDKNPESLFDFASISQQEADLAKHNTKETGNQVDTTELKKLREKLLKLVSTTQRWPKDLSDEQKQKMLDDYIEKAFTDPSSLRGLKGETLFPNSNLRGLRYLHRRFAR